MTEDAPAESESAPAEEGVEAGAEAGTDTGAETGTETAPESESAAPADAESRDTSSDATKPAPAFSFSAPGVGSSEPKKGLSFPKNEAGGVISNPFSAGGSTAIKTSGFGTKGGIDCYAPANSTLGAFLKTEVATLKTTPKVLEATPSGVQSQHRKVIEIKDVRMAGVHYDSVFLMPKRKPAAENRIGASFQQPLHFGRDPAEP
jgi:hypothetical protein